MKFRELIKYQLDTGKPLSRQQKLVRLLLGFLLLMLLLTLLSRAADSLTVARVTTERPENAAIEHQVRKDGILGANHESAAVAVGGILVRSVEVHLGSLVKEGDLLFTLDTADVQRQLAEKRLERQKYQLQLAAAQRAQQKEETAAERAQERAEEDYEYALEKAQSEMRRAKSDWKDAEDRVDEFWDDHDRDDDDDWSIGSSRSELDTLEERAKEKKRAYNDALRARDEAVLAAKRAIEDAALTDPEGAEAQVLALDIQLLDLQIADLQTVLAQEGQVLSELDGVVTELGISTGKKTTGEASVVIAESSQGWRLGVTLDSDEAKDAARGDRVSVFLPGKQKEIQSVIETIAPSSQEPGAVEVVALVPEGELGQSATMQISKKGDNYPVCVPIGALHGAEGDQYVLRLTESETVLGRVKTAERVSVTLEDSNDTRAAVSGALSGQDEIIVSSSKSIDDGDRVRLEEPQP